MSKLKTSPVATNVNSDIDIQPIKDFLNMSTEAGCMICIHTSTIPTDSLVFGRSGSFIDVRLPNGVSVLLKRIVLSKMTKVIYYKYIDSGNNEDVIKKFFIKFMNCLFNVIQASLIQSKATVREHVRQQSLARRNSPWSTSEQQSERRVLSILGDECSRNLVTVIKEEFGSYSNENPQPYEFGEYGPYDRPKHVRYIPDLDLPYRLNSEETPDPYRPSHSGEDVATHLIQSFDHPFAENFTKAGIPLSEGLANPQNNDNFIYWSGAGFSRSNAFSRPEPKTSRHVLQEYSKTLDENVFVMVPHIGIVLLKQNNMPGLSAVENLRFYTQSMSYLDTCINYDYKFMKSYLLDDPLDFKHLYCENNTDIDEECTWAIKLGQAILSDDQPVNDSRLYRLDFGSCEGEPLTNWLVCHCVDLQGIRPICQNISDFCDDSLMVDFINLVKNYPIDSQHQPQVYDSTNDDSTLWLPSEFEDADQSSSSEETDSE